MSPRPAIFISAVSRELRSARQLVVNTLTFLGYEPDWQDIFGTEEGDLRALLRRRIDACQGVVQLVGECYGAEPPSIDQQFGRVSYTQYEALYALNRGKKVWYLFLDKAFPTDPHEPEEEEKQKLQSDYRTRVQTDAHLYHPLSSHDALEASVLKLRDELSRLRSGVRRWAAFVAALLVLIAGLSIWLVESQQHSNRQLQTLQEKFDKLQQGVSSFAAIQNQLRQEQPGQKADQLEQRTYEQLANELGIDAKVLKEQLPRFAQELRNAPNATTYERANAAYVEKDYNEAERLALAAADEAEHASPAKTGDAIKAYELAAWAAEKRIEYAEALNQLRDAEKLTDRTRDSMEWARIQTDIARMLSHRGQYKDAEAVYRAVQTEQERVLGSEHPDTLATRNNIAVNLYLEGRYSDAESDFRALISLEEKALGAEVPMTLSARNNLGTVLYSEGKYGDAEAVFRTVIRLREKVLGPEHPDTLATRNNLTGALFNQGKYLEAENECRAVISLKEKTLGAENPQTLATRNNLGNVLCAEGKYTEAETELRSVLKLKEKVLGPEHPETLVTRHNLAEVLADQGKYADAETEGRSVIRLREKVLGPEHPDTLVSRGALAELLGKEGKYAEAESEYRTLIELREKVVGSEHPDTLLARSGLAEVLADEGSYIAAEAEYRTALRLQEKVIGPDNPATLQTNYNLALCLRAQNKFDEANTYAQRALQGALKVLGENHPETQKYEKLAAELSRAGLRR
jgi:tetratricopeptide (TPR) repeat protein